MEAIRMAPQRRLTLIVAAASLLLLARAGAAADAEQHGHHAMAGSPAGEVKFPVSCSAGAQKSFGQAVWLLHSFWYEEAVKAFSAITAREPACAMGYWGIAMSHWYPLWYPPGPAALKAGADAVAQGLAVPPKTERERDYLAAIGRFYQDSDKLDHRTRALAYEKAMEQIHVRYPDDREAAVFYALALNATALPTDKTYANQKTAAAILETVGREQPDHPGVLHYLIHSYDAPPLAEAGLKAARRYAAVAPEVPHAQHMPSHIFTRLGLWQESIGSNLIGHRVAFAYAQETIGVGAYDQETMHTMDYLAYAYLQTAQDGAAKGVLDELRQFRQGAPPNLPIAYAGAAIPARYALERRNWAEAAAVTVPAFAFPWDRFAWAEAMISFTRALGAARTGDLAAARVELAKLQAEKDGLSEAKNDYWANQVDVQRLGAAGVVAHVEGRDQDALELTRQAVALEASMDKHPATPGAVLPARELRGDLLLELNQPAAALAEYEQSLRTDPNRFRSLLGVARAAQATGDRPKAKATYQQLIAQCAKSDTPRPELIEARNFVAN
jgi:tetratricopeptide (TPR) repeat protein